MAGNAIDVKLCDLTFCTTVYMRSTRDCRSISSSGSESHFTINICLQGRAPDGVAINTEFGWFSNSLSYTFWIFSPAAFIIASVKNPNDEIPIITSTYQC
ncbi:unnamed protein product [Rotaria sp. Silwood2]|nr:unnamed protein product [Rotaria sp. Silwood2]